MVKEQFVEEYDVPLYKVGVAVRARDPAVHLRAEPPRTHRCGHSAVFVPDMVSQAVHVGDCELLEFYMDALDGTNPRWKTWTNRSILEGLAASNTLPNPYTGGVPGLTECINGWRGLAPLVLNWRYGAVSNMQNFCRWPPSPRPNGPTSRTS